MTTWIEPPPPQKRMGCLGKGCLLIIGFLVFLVVAFVIGFYVGTKPKEIPPVQTSEAEQNAVRARWDEFEAASRNPPVVTAVPPQVPPPADGTPIPEVVVSPTPSNRIELTAGDINQLIARSRKTRGKAFVSIDNNVARIQVTVPLDKAGFSGRSLNGQATVRASQDGNPRHLQISEMSLGGFPDSVLNLLLGNHSIQYYVDGFADEYGITSFTIENNKAILETSRGR